MEYTLKCLLQVVSHVKLYIASISTYLITTRDALISANNIKELTLLELIRYVLTATL